MLKPTWIFQLCRIDSPALRTTWNGIPRPRRVGTRKMVETTDQFSVLRVPCGPFAGGYASSCVETSVWHSLRQVGGTWWASGEVLTVFLWKHHEDTKKAMEISRVLKS